jgi:hypothetical protein
LLLPNFRVTRLGSVSGCFFQSHFYKIGAVLFFQSYCYKIAIGLLHALGNFVNY